MALVEISKTWKAVIVLVVNLVAAAVLGFADIFGWTLDLWMPITAMLVIVLDTVFAIRWEPPKKPSDTTGGSS